MLTKLLITALVIDIITNIIKCINDNKVAKWYGEFTKYLVRTCHEDTEMCKKLYGDDEE